MPHQSPTRSPLSERVRTEHCRRRPVPVELYYFVAPIQWSLAFPFFQLAPPTYYPWVVPGYLPSERWPGSSLGADPHSVVRRVVHVAKATPAQARLAAHLVRAGRRSSSRFHRSTYDTIGDALGFIPQFVTLFIGHPEIIKDTYNCGSGVCGTYEAALSHWNLYNGYDLELDVASPTAGWQVTFHMFDQDQRLSGDIVYLHNTGFQRTVKTVRGQETVAIPLQGGLNRIDITVPGSRPISFYALQTSRIPPAKRAIHSR